MDLSVYSPVCLPLSGIDQSLVGKAGHIYGEYLEQRISENSQFLYPRLGEIFRCQYCYRVASNGYSSNCRKQEMQGKNEQG